jgi:hypothetical protein
MQYRKFEKCSSESLKKVVDNTVHVAVLLHLLFTLVSDQTSMAYYNVTNTTKKLESPIGERMDRDQRARSSP